MVHLEEISTRNYYCLRFRWWEFVGRDCIKHSQKIINNNHISCLTHSKEGSKKVDKGCGLSKGTSNKIFLGQARSNLKSIWVGGWGNSSSRNTVETFTSNSTQRLKYNSELNQTTTSVDPKTIPLIELNNRHELINWVRVLLLEWLPQVETSPFT